MSFNAVRSVPLLATLAILAIAVVLAFNLIRRVNEPRIYKQAVKYVGRTSVELVNELGNPDRVILRTEIDQKLVQFPIPTYVPAPSVLPESKCFLYRGSASIVYVYINSANFVTQVFVAWT